MKLAFCSKPIELVFGVVAPPSFPFLASVKFVRFSFSELPSVKIGSLYKLNIMHALFTKAHLLSHKVIGAAIEVHRNLGPGLIESIYERCLIRELNLRALSCISQRLVKIEYKGLTFEEPLRFDLLVGDCLLVELKSVEQLVPVHQAQLLSYMKLMDVPIGLLINFHEPKLTDGIKRMILPGSNFTGEPK